MEYLLRAKKMVNKRTRKTKFRYYVINLAEDSREVHDIIPFY